MASTAPLRWPAAEYLLLLNPDTVVHPGSIDRLLAFARAAPEHGLYGGRTVNPDGTTHPGSCWGAPSLWSLFCFATMLSTRVPALAGLRPRVPRRLAAGHGAGGRRRHRLSSPRPAAVWRELGGFDPRFFMYGEDVDLALRAAARGYRPVITPDAVITHEIGVSSESRPEKFGLVLRGKVTLFDKHWSPPRRAVATRLLLAGVGPACAHRARGPLAGTGRPDLEGRLARPPTVAHGVPGQSPEPARQAADS